MPNLIKSLNIFQNIKSLIFKVNSEFNAPELIHKINLPNLKYLSIKKRSDLNYFVGLKSVSTIHMGCLDDIDYSIIDKSIYVNKISELAIFNYQKVDKEFLSLFPNLQSLRLDVISLNLDFKSIFT